MTLDRRITLTPIEQRYLATCYPLPDRPCIAEAQEWKQRLTMTALDGQDISVTVREILRPFPHLGRLICEGFFDDRTVQSYFEGTDDASHNTRLYLFARRVMRKGIPQEILAQILEHVDHCSVTAANGKGRTGFFGTKEGRADNATFHVKGEYALIHGKSERGPVAVREVTREEYELLTAYFKRHARLPQNI